MVATEQLLRYAGLLVWFLIVIAQIASPDGWRNHIPIDDNLLRQTVVWILLVVFACCYWVNTRDIPSSQTSPRVLVLLLIQFIAALLVTSDLSFIVSAEAALVLCRRHAIYWLICQSIAMLLWGLFLVNYGTFHTITLMNKGDPNISFWITISYVITWQVFSFCGGWFVANEAISRKEVSHLNAQLLLAQSELEENSRGEERLRISREIHDAIGHNLVALSLQLDLAERLSEPQKSSHLSTAKKLASQMLTEIRGVVGILREPQEIDLRLAVETLASNIPAPKIHSNIAVDLPELPAKISRTIWRCLQESVNNAVKHSQAANLWINISIIDTALLIIVMDDGIGSTKIREGNGLQGMRERLHSIAGKLVIASTGTQGFVVKMTIPFKGATP